MNLNRIMRKLQRAIVSSGFVISLDTTQFYSEDQKRMITIYILSIKIYENTGDAGLKKVWEQKLANTRPSGSDLRNAYQELKNIAFYMDGKIENNQLIIDEDVLRAYSPKTRNS